MAVSNRSLLSENGPVIAAITVLEHVQRIELKRKLERSDKFDEFLSFQQGHDQILDFRPLQIRIRRSMYRKTRA